MITKRYEASVIDSHSKELLYGPEEFSCEVTEPLARSEKLCLVHAEHLVKDVLGHRVYCDRDFRERTSGKSWEVFCQEIK